MCIPVTHFRNAHIIIMMMMITTTIMMMMMMIIIIIIIIIIIMMMMMMMMVIIIIITRMIMILMIVLKGAVRTFLQSPHCAANSLQHIRSSSQGAIVCKSCATHRALITINMSCYVPRGTKRQLSH